MTTRIRRLCAIGGLVIAASVLAFGAHAAFASARSGECTPGSPGYVGECPPYNADSCDKYCQEFYQGPGNNCLGGCCICAYR